MNRKFKRTYCHIINVFNLTFDQFNASLLNKSINNKKNLTDPKLLNSCVTFYICALSCIVMVFKFS